LVPKGYFLHSYLPFGGVVTWTSDVQGGSFNLYNHSSFMAWEILGN